MRNFILLLFLITSACACDKIVSTNIIIEIKDTQIDEKDENTIAEIVLEISSVSDKDISFKAKTLGGTASQNDDYVPLDTILFFRAGTKKITLPVVIKGDDNAEQDETILISLSDPFNATFASNTGKITIKNDDIHGYKQPATGYTSPESYPGMNLVWRDEFNGTSVDEKSWTFNNGDGCAENNCGWGNKELQYYQTENTKIVNGNLVIEARKEKKDKYDYTSSKLITRQKVSFKYGRIDVRAVMPFGKGMWPAVWMLGNNLFDVGWPAAGEIDIMEMVGGGNNDNICLGTVHWAGDGNQYASFSNKITSPKKLSDEYHVYSIEWDEKKIRWLFDDRKFHEIDITPSALSEFRKEFYLILNVAVGGNLPGPPDDTTLYPQWMSVDYVRYFQTK